MRRMKMCTISMDISVRTWNNHNTSDIIVVIIGTQLYKMSPPQNAIKAEASQTILCIEICPKDIHMVTVHINICELHWNSFENIK